MKTKRQVEQDGLIVTHFCGLHTYKDAIKALNELVELNDGRKSIYEIIVNDEDIKLEFSREEEQDLIGKVESNYAKYDNGALAVVAYSDFVFGMSRMLEISVHNERMAISVFRSEELARKWIGEIKGLQSRQPHAVSI